MNLGSLATANDHSGGVSYRTASNTTYLQRKEQRVEGVVRQLSAATVETIRHLDLGKVTPQRLRDVASDLYWDGQISREAASMLFSLGHDQPEDVEFDALEVLRSASEFELHRPADKYRPENLRLYRECQDLASGLRIATDFLRQGHSLSAVA